jgi:ADP-ribosylglycohydrolase
MALCLADAIIECDGQINRMLSAIHLRWALVSTRLIKTCLPDFKIALNAIRDGKPVSELENNGVTNGAAMRASRWAACCPATRWNTLLRGGAGLQPDA